MSSSCWECIFFVEREVGFAKTWSWEVLPPSSAQRKNILYVVDQKFVQLRMTDLSTYTHSGRRNILSWGPGTAPPSHTVCIWFPASLREGTIEATGGKKFADSPCACPTHTARGLRIKAKDAVPRELRQSPLYLRMCICTVRTSWMQKP